MSVALEINQRSIPVVQDATLFDMADQVGILVPTSCNRQGKCRECLMEVVVGMDQLSPRTAQEAHLSDNFRLSCRTTITGEAGRIRCHTLHRSEVQIVDEAVRLPTSGRPPVLNPAVTRDGDRVLLDGKEIARSAEPLHGVALDIGTTTVALRLINLEDGSVVATQAFENPQRFGGSDVMARIKYDSDHKGRLLQRVLTGYLSHAIEAFPVDSQTIYELVVSGNATMRDLFFGINVHSIGQKPYRSLTEEEMLGGKRESTTLSVIARRLGLPVHPEARVLGLPLIGCHIGADTAACLLAIEMDRQDKLVALMDIGTNTELVIGTKDRLLAASCPAGPAFEGGELSCGMPGVEGAVEHVRILDDGGLKLGVIGNKQPEGLCGSGLIDCLGELLRTGRMNRLGRYKNGEDAFYLDSEQKIYLLEQDISLLAQAKGANVAGLYTVFEQYGVPFSKIQTFYLAGGFARHINVEAAKRIGLVPSLPGDTIVQVGNASLEGATIALCCTERRSALEKMVRKIKHVELETNPNFFDHFVAGCHFMPFSGSAHEVLQ